MAYCREIYVVTVYKLCFKKVPTFKLSVTLSNLNGFSKFLHRWKACEISNLLQNLYDITHLTFDILLHYLGKLKIRIFCRYLAHVEENANKFHLSAPILIPLRL